MVIRKKLVETGMYYCKSRYYVYEWCRWLNGDHVAFLDTEDINGMNLFSYCGNNPITRMDSNGNAWYHWLIGAAIVIGLATALVVTAGGFAGAAIALTQVAYGYAASTMATTVLAGATIGASLALGGCAAYAIANSSSAMDFLDQGNGWTIGITATGGLLGAAGGYLNFANYGYTQYGDKTLSTNYPFGRYYNEKYETITHYDWRGRMWWSKHLTDHGNPNVHSVPHWHIENPHNGGGFNSVWELVQAIISRWF